MERRLEPTSRSKGTVQVRPIHFSSLAYVPPTSHLFLQSSLNYSYGWDWGKNTFHLPPPQKLKYVSNTNTILLGPVLMTVGPWKPITLETYQTRITDLDVRSEVSETLDVKLSATFTFSEKTPGFASFVLKSPDGEVEASSNKIPVGTGHAKVSFEWDAGQLQLWYPVGYGAQPLYTVEVELTDIVSRQRTSLSYKI